MTREELIARTRQLVEEGDRLQQDPTLRGLQTWLQLSDDLLVAAWGSMDRYHLAWLMVGKPKEIVRGRPLSRDEEAAYAMSGQGNQLRRAVTLYRRGEFAKALDAAVERSRSRTPGFSVHVERAFILIGDPSYARRAPHPARPPCAWSLRTSVGRGRSGHSAHCGGRFPGATRGSQLAPARAAGPSYR